MTDTTTLAPTDAEIEELLKSCGMRWVERSFWLLEDADLHPAIRAVLAKWGAPAPASDALRTAAQAIVARWDTPHWKDAEHTGAFIQRLREALAAPPAQEARDGCTLSSRIAELTEQHGSLRAAARSLDFDPGYLARLQSGEKCNPSPALLERLGLRQVITYVRGTT